MNRTSYFINITSVTLKDAFMDYPNAFKVLHHGYQEAPPMNEYSRRVLVFFSTQYEAKLFLKKLENSIKKFN